MNVVKWYEGRIELTRPADDLKFKYFFVSDPLDWGPHHVNLATQRSLRLAYFGWPSAADAPLACCCQALERGEEVTFWCEPVLVSCLCLLWALESLAVLKVPLHSCYLAASPGRTDIQRLDPDEIRRSIRDPIPVGEVLDPLVALRRHLASDSDAISVDRSSVPSQLSDWLAVAGRLVDYLPDSRGLDILDQILLDRLSEEAEGGEEWPNAAMILGRANTHPDGHSIRTDCLWERLLQLSGFTRILRLYAEDEENRLIEARFDGDASFARAHFRLTPLGRKAREGEIDFLPLCPFVRWIGGRQVSRVRQLRRPIHHSALRPKPEFDE
jgi:hypothetical protein